MKTIKSIYFHGTTGPLASLIDVGRCQRLSGVYGVKCIVNNKVYVGSSVDIYARLRGHLKDLVLDRHFNILLQRSWNKYGPNPFVFYVLEECQRDKHKLISTEQKWIDSLQSYGKGFNLRPKANSSAGIVWREETNAKRRLHCGHWCRGKKYTDEHRKLISIGMKQAWADGKFEGISPPGLRNGYRRRVHIDSKVFITGDLCL